MFLKYKSYLQNSIICFLFFGLFFFLLNLFYNQGRVSAQESIQCEPQIPIGETLDRNGELLVALYQELININNSVYELTKTAEEMIEFSGQCDISVCQAVDCGVNYNTGSNVYSCSGGGCAPWDPLGEDICDCPNPPECFAPQDCTSPWQGQACPQEDIETAFQKVDNAYKKIEASKKEIWALINGVDENVDRREPLCAKENDDIRTGFEEMTCALTGCKLNPLSSDCEKITKVGVIGRKLDRSRQGFDACSVSQTAFLQMAEGEIPTKSPLSCQMVIQKGFQRKQPDCRCAPGISPLPVECEGLNKKSLLNYYCCR